MTGNVIRPRIDEDYVLRIKSKYPKETALLNNEETLCWALEEFLTGKGAKKDAATEKTKV